MKENLQAIKSAIEYHIDQTRPIWSTGEALVILQGMLDKLVPVYMYRRKPFRDYATCDKDRYLELKDKENLYETKIAWEIKTK
jgi:hypothetical protein